MPPTVLIEVPTAHEFVVRRLLALTEELDQLALAAPDGTVVHSCEEAVIKGGREVQRQILADAVARRVESAEKRGPRSGRVSADGPKKTVARKPVGF